VVTAFGQAVYDNKQTTLYRQHGNNVIGYSSSKLANLKMRLRRVRSRRSEKNTLQLMAFLRVYGEVMKPEYKAEGEKFLKKQRNFFTRLGYVFTTKAYRQRLIECFIFRMMYLFGRYNVKKFKENKE
jgi:hypothetical protein